MATLFIPTILGYDYSCKLEIPLVKSAFQLGDEIQLGFILNMFNVTSVVAAHIHCASAGEDGAVGATLFGPVTPGGGSVDIFLVQGAITAPDAGVGGLIWLRSVNTYSINGCGGVTVSSWCLDCASGEEAAHEHTSSPERLITKGNQVECQLPL